MIIDEEKCNGCGTCVDACPMEAIQFVNGKAQINQELCRACEACLNVCPTGALTNTIPLPQLNKKPEMEIIPANRPQVIPVKTSGKPHPANWAAVLTALLSSDIIPQVTDLVNNILTQRTKTNPPIKRQTAATQPFLSYGGGQRGMRRRLKARNRRFSNLR